MKTTVLKKNVTQSLDELCAKRGEALKRIVEIWSEIEAEDREALDRAVTIFSLLLSRRG